MPEPIRETWTADLVKEAVEGINGPFVEGDYEFDEASGEKAAAYLNANEYDVREYNESKHAKPYEPGDYASDAAFVYDVIMWTSRL